MSNRPYLSCVSRLCFAADRIEQLTATSKAAEVTQELANFRELLWDLISVSLDPDSYKLAWWMIARYAKADLVSFLEGDEAALEGDEAALGRLKQKVREAIQLLP